MRLTQFTVSEPQRAASIAAVEARLLPLHRPQPAFDPTPFFDGAMYSQSVDLGNLDASFDQWFGGELSQDAASAFQDATSAWPGGPAAEQAYCMHV